jgi:hypothetical protein
MFEPRRLTTLWASTASYRDSFTLFFKQSHQPTSTITEVWGVTLLMGKQKGNVQVHWIVTHLLWTLFSYLLLRLKRRLLHCPVFVLCNLHSQDSAVGIVTGYGLDDRVAGARGPVGSRIFTTSSIPVLAPTKPSYAVGTGVFFPGGKAAG